MGLRDPRFRDRFLSRCGATPSLALRFGCAVRLSRVKFSANAWSSTGSRIFLGRINHSRFFCLQIAPSREFSSLTILMQRREVSQTQENGLLINFVDKVSNESGSI